MDNQEKWNARYRQDSGEPQAARVLRDYQHLLPTDGQALDMACGRGGNAILLARHGLQVDAWDISDVAMETLAAYAADSGLPVHARIHDVEKAPPAAACYDVVVVSYFLDRRLFPALLDALRPGGLLFYQTFLQSKVSGRGPRNPDYRLGDQELLRLSAGLDVLVYREEGCVGDVSKGFRDEVMYVGMKKR